MNSNEVSFIDIYYGCAEMDIYGVCWKTLEGAFSGQEQCCTGPGECLVMGGYKCPILENRSKQGENNE